MLALITSLAVPAFAATEIKAPAGTQIYTFSIDLEVSESIPYAGIQFGLTLSDESALTFVSFTQGDAVAGSSAYPFVYSHGVHAFGFWTGVNGFQGSQKVGTLNFTYSGTSAQTITIIEMMVIRIDGSKPVASNKESPVYVIEVSRESGSAGPTGPGQGGQGSGNPTIVIEEEDAPLAEFESKSKYFDDVPEEKWPWAVDEIDFLFEAGVINGTATRIYSPAANIKRGDFMLMLARAYDLFEEFSDNFSDVPKGSYYYDAIGAAKKLGIAKGTGDNKFAPDTPITRQDMMVLVHRTLEVVGKPVPAAPQSVLTSFADYAIVSDYAREAVAALVQSGIIKGDGAGINPLGKTTRAEMAVVVYRILVMD
jgi:hypothetical protein